MNNTILMVSTSYKVVEKKETKVLIKILRECKAIRDAFGVMSFYYQDDDTDESMMISLMNKQIDQKLNKLYTYYSRHYNIKFDVEYDEEYTKTKATEDNIALICETVRSWEE